MKIEDIYNALQDNDKLKELLEDLENKKDETAEGTLKNVKIQDKELEGILLAFTGVLGSKIPKTTYEYIQDDSLENLEKVNNMIGLYLCLAKRFDIL